MNKISTFIQKCVKRLKTRLKTQAQQDVVDLLNAKVKALDEYITKLEFRIIELENFVEGAKGVVKETKRTSKYELEKKWLNGYPDETNKEV